MVSGTKAALSDAMERMRSDLFDVAMDMNGSLGIIERLNAIHAKRLAIFDGLDTAHKQMKYLKRHFDAAYVEPKVLYLGERTKTSTDEEGTIHTYKEVEANAMTFDLREEVVRVMTASDKAHDAFVETSRLWRAGTQKLTRPSVIADICDGSNFLEHPLLSYPEEDDVLIVPIILTADAVETCNPLGVSRGDHKIMGVNFTFVNLPPDMRTRHEFVCTAMLVLNDDLKYFGSTMVLGGCDEDLEPIAGMEWSVGAQLRKYASVCTQEPITVRGKSWRVKIVAICFTADFEAQGLFGFETEGSGANKFCRCCDFDRTVEGAHEKPTDYLTGPGGRKRQGARWRVRTAAEVKRQMVTLATHAKPAEFSKQHGIFSTTSPFVDTVTPGFDIVSYRPQDVMHMLACGMTLRDASAIVHRCVKVLKAFSIDDLNRRLAIMKEDSIESIDLPLFHPGITNDELIGPLLKASLKGDLTGDVAWRAWLAHVKFFNTMMATSFDMGAIRRLDDEIHAHQKLYAKVPGAHFLLKHHFARHVPKDILCNGPPRAYWCFPFEGYLRRVKHWAEHSNRKAELKHIATMLSLQSAYELTYG